MQTMRQRGFTLMEVLVALAVVAISLTALVGAVGRVTHNDGSLRDRTFADWVAMNELTSIRLAKTIPGSGSLDGDADMGGQKWHWKATFSTTEDPNLERVDVAVSTADQPDDPVWTVSGFLGNPQGTVNP
jgi:general secretion pathway protein I